MATKMSTYRLPEETDAKIRELSALYNVSQATIIAWAVGEFDISMLADNDPEGQEES